MKKGGGKSNAPELLGIHAVTVTSPDPRAAARLFTEMLGFPIRRDGDVVVIGHGPELLVRIEPGAPRETVTIEVAVKELPDGLVGEPDDLGGDSVYREAAAVRLVVRAFKRPPKNPSRR